MQGLATLASHQSPLRRALLFQYLWDDFLPELINNYFWCRETRILVCKLIKLSPPRVGGFFITRGASTKTKRPEGLRKLLIIKDSYDNKEQLFMIKQKPRKPFAIRVRLSPVRGTI